MNVNFNAQLKVLLNSIEKGSEIRDLRQQLNKSD